MDFFTRNPGQSIHIYPQPGRKPGTPIEQVFAKGPIQVQVLGVQELQVRLGVAAPVELCVVREELRQMGANPRFEGTRQRLALKLKILMFINLYSTHSLAIATGLTPTRILAAETGLGDVFLDDLERIAQVFGIKVVELFYAPGRTVAERVVLGRVEDEKEFK